MLPFARSVTSTGSRTRRSVSLFGGDAHFVNLAEPIAREKEIVVTQIGLSGKEVAMKGNLPGSVQSEVVSR